MIRFYDKKGEEGGEPLRLADLAKELAGNTPELKDRNINVILTDDDKVTSLAGGYLGDDSPTDVIAFNLGEDLPHDDSVPKAAQEEDIWGEVYISVEQAQRQADALGETLNRELAVLLVHGFLHLAGREDDTPQEKKAMLDDGEKIVSDFEARKGKFGS
jgi:probable rRNA maturation factor